MITAATPERPAPFPADAPVRCSEDAARCATAEMAGADRRTLMVFHLGPDSEGIAGWYEQLTAEAPGGTLAVRPFDVFEAALRKGETSVILAHNRLPWEGDLTPTPEEQAFTERIRRAGDVLGVRVADHIIVGPGGEWMPVEVAWEEWEGECRADLPAL